MARREVRARAVAALAAVGLSAAACAAQAPDAVRARAGVPLAARTVDLPAPVLDGAVSLERTLAVRRSGRTFASTPVPMAEIGQLLWAAQGVTRADGRRTSPSAGALYPLELYVLVDDELLRYLPEGHHVEVRATRPWRVDLQRAALGQEAVALAPVVFVVAAVPARTAAKYGARADDFVLLEAGHATQNLLLQAASLGLVATPIGGVDPDAVVTALALPPGTTVLYLVPVGHSSAPDS